MKEINNITRPIFLWGMSGSGKSTSGKTLAKVLNMPFIDLDKEIEQAEGSTISELFETKGEAYFRELEQKALYNCLNKKAVIATGGGTPCFFDNAEHMKKSGCCIYLEASPMMLVSRLKNAKTQRPLIAKLGPETALEKYLIQTLEKRRIFYESAHITEPALNFDPRKTAEELEVWFNSNK